MFVIGGKKKPQRVVPKPQPEQAKSEPKPKDVDLEAFMLQDNQELDPQNVNEVKPIGEIG